MLRRHFKGMLDIFPELVSSVKRGFDNTGDNDKIPNAPKPPVRGEEKDIVCLVLCCEKWNGTLPALSSGGVRGYRSSPWAVNRPHTSATGTLMEFLQGSGDYCHAQHPSA
ncbi:hypothetical protein AAFF_G00166470 [Aldrovandia affinis]|uniref:Uncharacterized protein n=1 Tax=Aldrovandia affinis TaxID=143900 RepID=A0AAD7RMI7_9TELE|nr:hypothetical protein AAFF_G00166470 [Aldrovandia affinis]